MSFVALSGWLRLVILVVLLVACALTGRLARPAAGTRAGKPGGLFALELATTRARFERATEGWGEEDWKAVVRAIGFDFGFIVAYALCLAFACRWAGAWFAGVGWSWARGLGSFGVPLAGAMFVAGVCDVVENVGLLHAIRKGPAQPWLAAAGSASAAKWVLTAVGLLYFFCGLVARGAWFARMSWNRSGR
jgi:hypothetical protein